ncbi:quinone oxidoreductase family protein [Edaphobacter dinghuensis]|uniref:Zinc-binding dehydrogenase n=1 Tax=Edaphobacter dinghuensis TaxID=1560005 RepID=A0A917M317_9BACT|nr:zinc-binding alcohol dehydrogenase family protein [Edaphobacter dinghuensis]GGG73764.1 zinc-binding dehydrogenase [Edaphobacter dinghuensis]
MKAAVVNSFDRVPEYGEFDEPAAQAGEVLVKVSAAGLSQLVRGQAAGRHYSSSPVLPFIPGVDGVGRLADGRRVYFAFPRSPFGSMAELTVVQSSQYVALPEELDDVTAAAAANPGMSSWVALNERAKFVAGETVLINGATGVSGRLAIQIAKYLGARRVIATGRNEASVAELPSLGADSVIALDQSPEQLTEVFRKEIKESGVNVILDYLWGASAESLIAAVAGHGSGEAEPRIRYVQIGSVTGQTITLSSGALRSSGLELLGSGLGSVSNEVLVKNIGEFMKAVVPGKLKIAAQAVPLSQVSEAWSSKTADRIVFTL